MRISDWSADVCSSDLKKSEILAWKAGEMKDADYRRKTAEAAEAKREVLAERERIESERSHYANHLDVVLGSLQARSEEHTSELQSLLPISYAVFCLTKKKHTNN